MKSIWWGEGGEQKAKGRDSAVGLPNNQILPEGQALEVSCKRATWTGIGSLLQSVTFLDSLSQVAPPKEGRLALTYLLRILFVCLLVILCACRPCLLLKVRGKLVLSGSSIRWVPEPQL